MKTKETTIETLWAQWSVGVPAQLLEQDGIKAQFAAAAAVVIFLNQRHKDGAWIFSPAHVGGFEDTALNIDGYLINTVENKAYAVDFSLESDKNPKGNKVASQWLVHLKREWFAVRSDGLWQLRPCCMGILARAFLPALSQPVCWEPHFGSAARKAS